MPREEMKRPLIRGRGAGSRPLEASASDPGTPVVGVLGTGDFSRSLTGRLVASGYQVVVGSRSPKRSLALFPEEAEVGVTPAGLLDLLIRSFILSHSHLFIQLLNKLIDSFTHS